MTHHPDEFIGSELKVIRAGNKSLEGLSGTVVDETKKSFTIRAADGSEKAILKNGCTFSIGGREVNGSDVEARPEERIRPRK